MTPNARPRVENDRRPRSWTRAVRIVTVLLFLALACAGIRGQLGASRQAKLDLIEAYRESLREALDARRSAATGPTPEPSGTQDARGPRTARGWAAKLESRISEFRSTYVRATEVEDQELRLGEASLAVAEGSFEDALSRLEAVAAPNATPAPDRAAEALSLKAGAYYDRKEWSTALEHYRRLLLLRPQDLTAVERVAECLYLMRQVEGAFQTYADLATRLHERGSRLRAQLDHRGAVRDLNKAATIRLWLARQGRRGLEADLAEAFSSCGGALLELRNLELAGVYLSHAIDIRTQLLAQQNRAELAGKLAGDYATYARVLLASGKTADAMAQLGSAIDLLGPRAGRARPELGRELATTLAQRGLVHEAHGRSAAAARDFERAAEAYAAVKEFGKAAVWQEKALGLASGDAIPEARRRLDRYRSGEPYRGP